ncbi:MAG TPA: VCBS repeat-containing protein [Pyrinomonadaceae bacterium]|jgi:hypothetical protein|nr:VCBS repeat-containing protein [Pyrinomonadaceae bacterium]
MMLLLLATLSSGGLATIEAKRVQPARNATLVCVVSRPDSENSEGTMDAVALIVNGKPRQPYPEYAEAAQRKFASQYFSTGKKYRLTFGGGEVGSATIKGFDMGCNNIHATALVEANGKIPAHLSALATNSESLGKKPSSRRAPTDAERAAVNLLVAQIYRSRGTSAAMLRTVVTTNLTATDLDGDGKFELIGSYTAESKTKARKDLLLIAELVGASFKAALVKFQAYQLPAEGFDSAVDFVDQLDLDGDGIAEVFVQQHGFDAYGYAIYKKTNGRWREVYTSTGDAC